MFDFRALVDRALAERWPFSRVIDALAAVPATDQSHARVALLEAIRDELERRQRPQASDAPPTNG